MLRPKNTMLATILATLLLLSGCASQPKVFSDFDSRFDFSATSTFTWVQAPPMMHAGDYPVSALAEARLSAAIKAELIDKGYRFVEDEKDADISLVYTMGAREKIEVLHYPTRYYRQRYDWGWGARYYPYFIYYPFDLPELYQEELHAYTEGTIALDIFDVATSNPVWHTRATKRLSRKELNNPASYATEIAAQLLQHFPAIGCQPKVSRECRPFETH